MSDEMSEGKFPKDWVLVADVDLSEMYEVDRGRIYKSAKGFVYARASGCSCWDGEWSIDEYEDLPDLVYEAKFEELQHASSWAGIDDLIKQAVEWHHRHGIRTPSGKTVYVN